jgi:Flp pilus assembly protein TadG
VDREGRQRGQATVELVLVLPVVVLLALIVAQAAVLARDQLLVVHAAREAARAAAVEPDPGAARSAATEAGPLDEQRLRTEVRGRGERGSRVTATVSYRAPTTVPLVGWLLGDLTLRASATMRVE